MDYLEKLDSVYRLHCHIARFMAITECSWQEAETVLTSTRGPQMYRRMLREWIASGGRIENIPEHDENVAQKTLNSLKTEGRE